LASGFPTSRPSSAGAYAISDPVSSYEAVTSYNNFYEFSTDKGSVAEAAKDFVSRPWTVAVGGLCAKPTTFDIDDLIKISATEQRIYRMRCVETWSMVIPWNGYSLSKLLDRVQPLSSANYVAFESLNDPVRMPNQHSDILNWPYVEGLRMDEAMHPMTMLATGIYGKPLPPQDGAPVRLVVPWKYGFKGAKSLVKITLVADQPPTTWSSANPPAYGFFANVNPEVSRPWNQSSETRITVPGNFQEQPTLMLNGYADQVGYLYAGMDLSEYY
jgi:sulfoxide reductase catalytic subunit YedY